MAEKSHWACRFTIERMFCERAAVQVQLDFFETSPDPVPYGPAPFYCYLHTLTFADPEPDEHEAARRFHNLRKFLLRTGKECVWVMERGEDTGRLHYHLVSSQRWDSAEMWDVLPRYNFGRYDVRQRPASRARYAAKYVGKPGLWKFAKGTRRWGVVGVDRTDVRSIERSEKKLVIVAEQSQFVNWLVWSFSHDGDIFSITLKIRPDAVPGQHVKMIELKPNQNKEVLATLGQGHVCALGEYRGCSVRTLKVEDRANPSGPRLDRVVVEHNVELGGAPQTVSEWLPPGADAKAVKAPAQRGEAVLVLVDKIGWFKGQKQCGGLVKSLATLGT